MKLITLNTWAGRAKKPLEDFLKSYKEDTDVFCFQEIFNKYSGNTDDYINDPDANLDTLQDIKNILVEFDAYFCPIADDVYGIATFVKRGIQVLENGEVILFENNDFKLGDETNDHTRKMQWLRISQYSKEFMIMNLHGYWDASGKDDTPERIEQSKRILQFVDSTSPIPQILAGDFNLNPDTESIKILERNLMNLIALNHIKTTRTELYTGKHVYADYLFTSPNVSVREFKVLPDVASDHAALFIEFV